MLTPLDSTIHSHVSNNLHDFRPNRSVIIAVVEITGYVYGTRILETTESFLNDLDDYIDNVHTIKDFVHASNSYRCFSGASSEKLCGPPLRWDDICEMRNKMDTEFNEETVVIQYLDYGDIEVYKYDIERDKLIFHGLLEEMVVGVQTYSF